MASASRKDLLMLLEGAQRLQEAETLDDLAQVALEVATLLVPCEHASYNEVDARRNRLLSIFSDPRCNEALSQAGDLFATLQNDHPVLHHIQRTGDFGPHRLSDFIGHAALHDLGLYAEVYRPLETEYQLVLTVPLKEAPVVGIAVNRRNADFSERDRQVLAMLQPFLKRAYHVARRQTWIAAIVSGRPRDDLIEHVRTLGLTRREAEMLLWAAFGKTNEEIGLLAAISGQTAKKHLQRTYAALGAYSRSGAVRTLLEHVLAMPRNGG